MHANVGFRHMTHIKNCSCDPTSCTGSGQRSEDLQGGLTKLGGLLSFLAVPSRWFRGLKMNRRSIQPDLVEPASRRQVDCKHWHLLEISSATLAWGDALTEILTPKPNPKNRRRTKIQTVIRHRSFWIWGFDPSPLRGFRQEKLRS